MVKEVELKRVIELIIRWLAEISANNCVDFYDINRVAEDLSSKLLNEIYDYNLENLNYEKNNCPGIDLGDKTNKIGFQVTSRKDNQKIIKSLEKFVKGPKNTYVNGIRFLILRQEKGPRLSNKKYKKIYPDFDPDLHILTINDLLREIKRLSGTDQDRFLRIKRILEQEIAGRSFENSNFEVNKKEIQLVKIFVAASKDLKIERDELIHIAHSTNKLFDHLKLEVVEWETDMATANHKKERAQDGLKSYLEDSEIVIALFFSKIGNFTLKEYNLAIQKEKKIFLYFKQGFSPQNTVESRKHLEVLKLLENLKKENQNPFRLFKTNDQFKLLMNNDLSLYLKKKFPPPSPILTIPVISTPKNPKKIDVPCPYRGLSAFKEEDADLFHGREEAVLKLFELVEERTITTVIGASGSGKSSLVFAGLIPKLKKHKKWLVATFRPGNRPIHALAACLVSLLYDDYDEIGRLEQTMELAESLNSGRLELQDVIGRILKKYCDHSFLLIADQFEELYTSLGDEGEENKECIVFLEELLKRGNSRCSTSQQSYKLVITLRADFLGQALSNSMFSDVLQHSDFKLGAMKREEIKRAIELPASLHGVEFADGLINRLVETVSGQAGDLPLLQFTLTLMWKNRKSDKLDHELYHAIGCVENALAKYADQIFLQLNKQEQMRAKKIFLQLVRHGKGKEDTRWVASYPEISDGNWSIVKKLADARLVVTGRNPITGGNIVEVVHEALITHWQRFREWVENDRIFISWKERLWNSISQWEMCDKDKGSLMRGFSLTEAEDWLLRRPEDISDVEKSYIEESRLNSDKEEEHLRALYEAAEAARKESEATRELQTHFFANISHEFRTPLTLIMYPLEQMLSENHDKEQKRELIMMWRNAQRVLTLINQLLKLSQLDSGKMSLRSSYENIISFLRTVLEPFQMLAQKKDMVLEFLPESEDVYLYFDVEKMEEVIHNLLTNAIKFTPPGGKITVSASINQPGWQNQQNDEGLLPGNVIISVHDTGMGIPEENMPYVFDRFFQVDPSKGKHTGTGIGLALAQEYVLLHQGKIEVRSQEGKETEFVVQLPLGKGHLKENEIVTDYALISNENLRKEIEMLNMEAEEDGLIENKEFSASAIRDSEDSTGKSEKSVILIVEDNADVRKYIREPLSPYYTVVEARDGKEGIEKAIQIIPDLIVSDIIMPKVNGIELCQRLKKGIETSHIPIILLTAKASEKSIIEGLEAGADDYVTKPFHSKILLSRINNLIDLRRQLQLKIQRQKMMMPSEISVSSLDDAFLKKFQHIIEQNLDDPDFTIDDLCNKLKLGRTSLFTKIKALTGETPNQFILSYRLERGAQLLRENFGNVTQVALHVGFSSPAYFAKCFKEKFYQSPSSFQLSESKT